jgi:hypothetical protein
MNILEFNPIIILMPVYEDAKVLVILLEELKKELGTEVYIVAVDDGSINQPLDIDILKKINLSGAIIKLNKNVGHQRAIAIGLNYIVEQIPNAVKVVIMDSDGEDKPSSITSMLELLENTEIDIVVAQRKNRDESLNFKIFYVLYKIVFRLLSGRNIGFGNFMVLKSNAIRRITAMQELWIHLAGCVLSSKLRISSCQLDRGSRYSGQSKMNFVGLVLHGFKAMMVFAEDVLVRVGIVCFLVATLSIFFSIITIGLKLFSYPTPGWSSIVLGILLLVFLQTGALTLFSLMLTGIARGASTQMPRYQNFIYRVEVFKVNKLK